MIRDTTPLADGIVLRRAGGTVATNIPWRVRKHSPDGFEWGYQGSGPADLALNIIEAVLHYHGYVGERGHCYAGTYCFGRAWKHHQAFKREVIAKIPHDGAVIPLAEVEQWIREHK